MRHDSRTVLHNVVHFMQRHGTSLTDRKGERGRQVIGRRPVDTDAVHTVYRRAIWNSEHKRNSVDRKVFIYAHLVITLTVNAVVNRRWRLCEL